jgi:hypothetical protein
VSDQVDDLLTRQHVALANLFSSDVDRFMTGHRILLPNASINGALHDQGKDRDGITRLLGTESGVEEVVDEVIDVFGIDRCSGPPSEERQDLVVEQLVVPPLGRRLQMSRGVQPIGGAVIEE